MAGGRYDVPMLGGVTAAALIDGVALLGLGGSHGLALHGEVMAQGGDGLADAADFSLALAGQTC